MTMSRGIVTDDSSARDTNRRLLNHFRLSEFLVAEANLLDRGLLRDWLALLAPDIRYQVPVRASCVSSAVEGGFSSESYLINDDLGGLETRVARFETEHAWAEIPVSRLRHFVSNVSVRSVSDCPEEFEVSSNLLLFRGRSDLREDALLSGARLDRLRSEDGALKLTRRLVLLDHTVLPMRDLAIFL